MRSSYENIIFLLNLLDSSNKWPVVRDVEDVIIEGMLMIVDFECIYYESHIERSADNKLLPDAYKRHNLFQN